jgi:hypothetical protein
MSCPKALFIDTSVFDRQNYNFRSEAIAALIKGVKGNGFMLLLPDPTEREVKRHIETRVEEACAALESAKRKSPLLSQWQGWPADIGSPRLKLEFRKLAAKEWEAFTGSFRLKKLGYEGIDLTRIMGWYDIGRAPFGLGKKRKEFPDALAVAALASAADEMKCEVAVISQDDDLKKACAHYSRLLHFSSLAAFTEAILMADSRVGALKTMLVGNTAIVEQAIRKSFVECAFFP